MEANSSRVDTLIHARWLVPGEPCGELLEHQAVAVRDGRVVEVGPSEQLARAYTADDVRHLTQHVLIPGLVNAHTHSPMTLMRGLADDLPLMEWLTQHIWPAEQRWVSEGFVRDGSTLAVAEMLRGGVTCFNDMYFHAEATAQAAQQAGMRAVVGMILLDFPSPYADGPEQYLEKGLALHDAWRDDPLISTAFAPHAPYTVSPQWLERVRTYSEELDVPVHIHVHETAQEVQDSLRETGKRPLARLDELGLVSPRLLAVHATQLETEEIERLAETGAHVIHCPEANLKLASGFCPAAALRRRGVNVAIGTDGTASNNDLDVLGEARTAALLGKGVAGDAAALPAAEVLSMATLGAAEALGLAEAIGSIVPGKFADLAAVSLEGPDVQPVHQALSQVIYAATRHHVTDVWVAGRCVLRERELTTLDVEAAIARASEWGARLDGKAPAA